MLLLVVGSYFQNSRDIVTEIQVLKRLLDVLTSNGFLGVLFGDLVRFRGDEGDEFDATFNQEIARVFCKGNARIGVQDFGNDLLDRRWEGKAPWSAL